MQLVCHPHHVGLKRQLEEKKNLINDNGQGEQMSLFHEFNCLIHFFYGRIPVFPSPLLMAVHELFSAKLFPIVLLDQNIKVLSKISTSRSSQG
jgi:hypothetical protein